MNNNKKTNTPAQLSDKLQSAWKITMEHCSSGKKYNIIAKGNFEEVASKIKWLSCQSTNDMYGESMLVSITCLALTESTHYLDN